MRHLLEGLGRLSLAQQAAHLGGDIVLQRRFIEAFHDGWRRLLQRLEARRVTSAIALARTVCYARAVAKDLNASLA
ncbi:hypothetical protein [Bosea sp. 685]|uniref:hypothetical protein n=1 Tax=Bosea sp. 685 TaxID=3080057 RepID=UPI0028936DB2|nr:hypothetical protein [Bosea sp. 685]WNJ88928.1 hypothetical protein RMR04_21270 [Bosea sp. 685]